MPLRYLILLLLWAVAFPPGAAAQEQQEHTVAIGDTWDALAARFTVTTIALKNVNPHPNPLRQPAVGDTIILPAAAAPAQNGILERGREDGLMALALRYGQNPWRLARDNGLPNPYRPIMERAVFIPGGDVPVRELPLGFRSLELSHVPAQPGEAVAFRALGAELERVAARLDNQEIVTALNGPHILGIGGTGAFLGPGNPELLIESVSRSGRPAVWAQPWRYQPGIWDYDQVTLTGEAAAIDQEAIAAERARLFAIWNQITPEPLWSAPFQTPIVDYLHISSTYGARRSYNGGPYRTYHEGLDFSAYRGTPVYAAAAGTVVLAETLYVRGGAVIIDHGLGIFSGYYHMSAVHAQPGQLIAAGDLVGEVGTTGLSSGNHLHWDLLAGGVWVDPAAWQERGLSCWLLAGWGSPC